MPIYIRPSYLDLSNGELRNVGYINQINTIGNVDSFNNIVNIGQIGKIVNVNTMSVDHISQINYIGNINTMAVDYISDIGYIGNIDTMSVGLITQISHIQNIGAIDTMSVDRINLIMSIGTIGSMYADTVSLGILESAESIVTDNLTAGIMNVTSADISTIKNVAYLAVTDADIQNITNVAVLDVTSATIETITGVNNLYVSNASIGVLTDVSEIHAVTAYVNTITSVDYLTATSASIDSISNVSNLNAITAQINTLNSVQEIVALTTYITVDGALDVTSSSPSTIINIYGTELTFDTGSIRNFLVGTISGTSINFSIGTINNLLVGQITGKGVDIDIGTIRQFNVNTISGTWVKFSFGSINEFTAYTINSDTLIINVYGSINDMYVGKIEGTSITFVTGDITNLAVDDLSGNFEVDADHIANLAINVNHLDYYLLDKVGRIFEAEDLSLGPYSSVESDSSASNGSIVVASQASPTHMLYGPYVTLQPGAYNIHFRLRSSTVYPNSTLEYYILDVNDYTADSVLVSKTLHFNEVADFGTEWYDFTLFVPNVVAGHTIETRVKLKANQTLKVDYVKLEPTGYIADNSYFAPTFKIQAENIGVNAIQAQHISSLAIQGSHINYNAIESQHISSLAIQAYHIGANVISGVHIGSLQIQTHHIDTFAITNSKIKTFEITYDRLVKPPIGWNEIINGGFEYGPWSGGAWTNLGVYSGKRSGVLLYYNTIESNVMNLKNPENSVVVSFAAKLYNSNYPTTLKVQMIWRYERTSSPTSTTNIATFVPPTSWTIYKYTIATSNYFGQLRFGAEATPNISARVLLDNISVTKGTLYTTFIDTTVARHRWLPDTYISKESLDVTFDSPSGSIVPMTLAVTIDYTAKAIVFAGINLRMATTVPTDSYTIPQLKVNVVVDNATIATKSIARLFTYPGTSSAVWCKDEIAIVDEATLTPGEHTLYIVLDNFLALTQIACYERYLRVLCGSTY